MKVSFQGIYDLYNKTVTPNEHGTLAVESSLDIFAENFEKIKISPHFAKVINFLQYISQDVTLIWDFMAQLFYEK